VVGLLLGLYRAWKHDPLVVILLAVLIVAYVQFFKFIFITNTCPHVLKDLDESAGKKEVEAGDAVSGGKTLRWLSRPRQSKLLLRHGFVMTSQQVSKDTSPPPFFFNVRH
jgi:hypothetical protein